jgi:hypothetical protein
MSDEPKIQPGKDEAAVVERVVPGKLVYVRVDETPEKDVYGFRLDKLVLRKPDGSCRPYRGEPLADLGVVNGRKLFVWGLKGHDVEPALVVDVDRPRGFGVTIGASISSSISSAMEKILK